METTTESASLKTMSPNFVRVELGPQLAIWFSYATPIAFEFQGIRVRRRND
jgi:hypothetical protein